MQRVTRRRVGPGTEPNTKRGNATWQTLPSRPQRSRFAETWSQAAQVRRVLLSAFALTAFFSTWSLAVPTRLLEEYGDGGRHFDKIEVGNMLVYFHQRMIGEATVEKDYIVYQLDKDTGELLARKSHWRNDLPAVLPGPRISREQAEAMVEGEIQFSGLYIISPESDVFPLNPTPEDPCWAVRSVSEHEEYVVTIIDAVSGVILGNGIPPPYTAYSMTGPWYFYPCDGAWSSWSQNAEAWFNEMGYSTEEVEWPTQTKVQSHIQSHETAMFYELAHGGSTSFAGGCVGGDYAEYTYASEIEAWMVGYEKMPFAFIGSCAGMCSTGNNTFAYEFRKGSSDDTAVVGYCGMSEPQCEDCWPYSIDWQDTLFYYMDLGYAVKDAYDQANADYAVCATGNCMRFAGDEDFAVVPVVLREGGPTPEVEADGCRYLLITPTGGVSQALLVTGDAGNSYVDCVSAYVQADGSLGPDPVFKTPEEWGTVTVSGLEIIPSQPFGNSDGPTTTYYVQADCGEPGVPDLKAQVPATMWTWADVAYPPDSFNNVADILAVIRAYQSDFADVTLERADLTPCEPDHVANITDILATILAYQGECYADSCSLPCP